MDVDKVLSMLTLEEKASLCSGEDFWHTKAVERLGISSVMVCDGPNGLRKQDGEADHLGLNESLRAVCFPTSSAVAASFDRDLAFRLGETLGEECLAENVAMLLGPGVNIKRSPLCGRNFEYYSEDPYQSSQIAAAYIKGIQSKGVGACIKHFAANNQETCRQSGDSVVDERTLHEVYLASFEGAVKDAKPWGVMCSYNRVNGTFAAENRTLLTEILRERWGYDGMVVTDWGAVKNRVKGIEAGLDLEMPGSSGSLANDKKIVEAVKNGTLSEDELNSAVRNVLNFLDHASHRETGIPFDREKDYQLALEAAKECAVLLKNDHELLPLKKGTNVAFLGGFVEKPRIQGSGSSHINSAKVPTVFELIRERDDVSYAKGFQLESDKTDAELLAEAVKLAGQCDAAVIFAGLPGRYEAEGADRKHLSLPANQNELIAAVCEVQPNTIVVLHNGAPVEMPWIRKVSAVLEMYLSGDATSEASMALLYGEATPSGKLAETFPLRLQDTPCYIDFPGEKGRTEYREGVFTGYRWYDKREMPVLFPFGHGLSYTTFQYSSLRLSKDIVRDNDTIQVSVEVTNTGKVNGKETVQLYVGQIGSTVRRPIRELKGFEKVTLAPGEKKTVSFLLDMHAFSYYEPAIHDWYAESGNYQISVGSSSRDIRESVCIQLETEKHLPIQLDLNTNIGDLLRYPPAAPVIQKLFGDAINGASTAQTGESMGEGADALASGAMEMPIGALASFGIMDEEALLELLDAIRNASSAKDYKEE